MAPALTVDGGEEAGAQVVVQVLVLAHLKHLLPLLLRHLALDALCSLLLLPQLLTAKLQGENTHVTEQHACLGPACFFSWGENSGMTMGKQLLLCLSLTRGLVGATLQAKKASLYESSLTPRAFSPLKPSDSKPWGPPATRVLVSARTPAEGTAVTAMRNQRQKIMHSSTILSQSEILKIN